MDDVRFTADAAVVDWQRPKSDLAADRFDNGRSAEQLRVSFENSYAIAFALSEGRVVKVRALSDGICNAYVIDVWTQTAFRRRGIGTRLIGNLLARLPGQHV